MIQQMNEKVAPFQWYNHSPHGHISRCIKIEKMLKKYFVTDDSPPAFGINLKTFTDSYRAALEKRDGTKNEMDHLRFFGSEKEEIMLSLSLSTKAEIRNVSFVYQ